MTLWSGCFHKSYTHVKAVSGVYKKIESDALSDWKTSKTVKIVLQIFHSMMHERSGEPVNNLMALVRVFTM